MLLKDKEKINIPKRIENDWYSVFIWARSR